MFRRISYYIPLVALVRWKHDSPPPPSHSNNNSAGAAEPSSSSFGVSSDKQTNISGDAGSSSSGSSSSLHENHTERTSSESKDSQIPGSEGNSEPLFAAMKEGNFTDLQNHAAAYFQQRWKEEYNLPAGLVIISLIVWYWIAWTNRSIKRKCAAMESMTEKEVQDTRNTVQKMVDQYKSDMLKASTDLKLNMAKNAELIAEIDRLTAALRSCHVQPSSS